MHALYQTSVIADDYRYGDLYRLANLPQFKEPVQPCPPRNVPVQREKINLYIIGDSFTEPGRVGKSDFPVAYYQRVQWDKQTRVQLDTSAQNVLVIESVERHFREHAAAPSQNLLIVADTNGTNGLERRQVSFRTQLIEFIRGKGMEERLETVLFSHDFFLWFRELKAMLTLKAFDRVTPTVALSTDSKHLLLNLDVDSSEKLNAGTSPLTNNELDNLVNQVNKAAVQYKAAGFDRVILSIIPNKTTLVDPARTPYNQLVTRVQTHQELALPVVDVLTPYQTQAVPPYALGDSHWNCTGRTIWLDAVTNALLATD